jgi:AraC-like DNA-binding protein
MSNSGNIRALKLQSGYEHFESDSSSRRLLIHEETKLALMVLVEQHMNDQNITRAQLARKMKISVKKLRRVFEGEGLTIKMFADMLWVLNRIFNRRNVDLWCI